MYLSRKIHPLAAVVLLSVSGCGAAPEVDATSASPAVAPAAAAPVTTGDGSSSGVVETAGGRYTFAATTCAIHLEGDAWDVEIAGPGKAPDGEKVFVQFSSTGDVLTIDLGIDSAFDSSERSWQAGQYITNKLKVDVSGRTVRVAELELVDLQGNRQPGSFEAEC